MEQLDIFGIMYDKYTFKDINLIELFAGYGSQALALKYLGVKFKHHKIVEWATKSIQAYNEIHFQDNTDYSKEMTDIDVLEFLVDKGISMDYNQPMTREQIKRKGVEWQRKVYNDIIATHNLVDISRVHASDLEMRGGQDYIMTYSFPCQDLSLAGLRNGMERDSGTRSGLLWQVERILLECKETGIMPRVLLMENVPEVCGSNNQVAFNDWCSQLTRLGYHNTMAILNAKDFGIPQNRRRCFMLSIYGEYAYSMPSEMKLEYKLKDLLESNVDEKYYLSSKQIEEIKQWNAYEKPLTTMERTMRGGVYADINHENRDYTSSMILVQSSYVGTYQYAKSDNFMKGRDRLQEGKEIADTLQTNGKEGVVVYEPNLKQELCDTLIEKGLVKENDVIRHSYTHNRLDNGIENMGRVQSKDNNIMPTLDTRSDCFGIVVKELIPYGSYYTWKDNQGNINTQCNRAVDENGVALTVACAETGKVLTNNLRIRKLTPRECMRLMGVKDSDSCKIKQSDASIYHLAGDSIVTTCLMGIFGELLGIDYKSKIEELVENIRQK